MGSRQTPGMSNAKLTKDERREAAREKARRLREAEEKRQKRNKMLTIGAILAAILIVALIVVKVITGGEKEKEYDGSARPATLANVTDDFGIYFDASGKAGQKVDGVPVVGVFADLMCSACVTFDKSNGADMVPIMQDGKATIIHYPVSTQGTDFSTLGAAAEFYVATYAPDQWLKFKEGLYERSTEIFAGDRQQPNPNQIAMIAEEVGVPADVVKDLPASIKADDWTKVVTDATQKFREKGFRLTPTVVIDGKENVNWGGVGGLKKVVDAL